MLRVGVRELRDHMGRYIAMVKAGESIMITRRGKDVAIFRPYRGDEMPAGKQEKDDPEEQSDEIDDHTRELMRRLRAVGISWSGQRLRRPDYIAPVKHGSVAEIVVEDRGEQMVDM